MDELPGDGLIRLNVEIVALIFFILLDEGYYCYFCGSILTIKILKK